MWPAKPVSFKPFNSQIESKFMQQPKTNRAGPQIAGFWIYKLILLYFFTTSSPVHELIYIFFYKLI